MTNDGSHEADHKNGHDHTSGSNLELIFAILCGTALAIGWFGSVLNLLPGWLSLGLFVAAYGFGGYFALREAVEKSLSGKFEIDFLMLVAAAGAAILGAWAEGALLLFLFSIGHALENYAMGRAGRAIEALRMTRPVASVFDLRPLEVFFFFF